MGLDRSSDQPACLKRTYCIVLYIDRSRLLRVTAWSDSTRGLGGFLSDSHLVVLQSAVVQHRLNSERYVWKGCGEEEGGLLPHHLSGQWWKRYSYFRRSSQLSQIQLPCQLPQAVIYS